VAAIQTPDYVYTTDIRPFIEYGVPVLEEGAPLQEAIAAVGRSPSRTVLLKRPNSRELAGIITSCDLSKIERLSPAELAQKTARDLATTSGVLGIRCDAMLWQLLRLINGDNTYKRPFDQVPVLDNDKQIVGLISREFLNRRMLEYQYTNPSTTTTPAPSGV
jgi:CBS-domain-containing membrane protein